MARKKETFNIGDHSVEIFQLPVPVSLKVLTRLTKILSKPIGSAISGDSKKSALDKEIDFSAILGGLGDRLDEEIVISTILMTLPYVTVDQKPVNSLESFDDFGVIFLLKVMAKVLEVNYGDFLGGFLARGKEKLAEIQTPKE